MSPGSGGPSEYTKMRDVWGDHTARQAAEHELIDRKPTWLLAADGLPFTAYGVTY